MSIADTVCFLVLPLFAYALGSVPWGVVLTRTFTAVDIRTSGSGNIGATNVRRTAGTAWGILTLVLDVLKGWVPTFLAVYFVGTGGISKDLYVAVVLLAAFTGHLFPLYTKGKGGGKGVATAGGCFLAVSPAAVAAAVSIFLVLIFLTRRVSAGSLAAAALIPAVLWKFNHSLVFTAAGVLVAAGIFIRHRENIRRLAAGKEPPL
ncbi:MAG: glycerol-3-phosphate 1-O-acyltransferase PlsY [Desulfococcus multivorans]|jgi:glycerol-3-phosphate acyltransferase PlsY|uniref:glycerol-3-phosphate 1-O-acyltransferase PlsY n=1 Tax=Desulfococcus sp. TaxID=2025834 RepID=UPI002A376D8D|nr:glycerol-3-phosphate 1-O-acyltransferase PlsY [Desulfococcus multivorans]